MKVNYKNISEEYFKPIETMKKGLDDKSVSGADRIRKDTKAIMLADRIQKITDDQIYDNVWSKSQNLPSHAEFVNFTNKIKSSWSDVEYKLPYHYEIHGSDFDIANGITIIRTNSCIDLNISYELRIDHVDGLRVIAELTQYTRQQLHDGLPFSKKTGGTPYLYNLSGFVPANYEIDYTYACQERLKESGTEREAFFRLNYYDDPRPLLKFFLTDDKKRHIAMAVLNMQRWLTSMFANTVTREGVPFNISLYIKQYGGEKEYMFFTTKDTPHYDKYYSPDKVDESYIKTIDKMKADAEKSTSGADEIRKHAKKVYISDIVENCDINTIYAILLSVFRRNQNTSAAIQGGYKPKVDVKSDIIDFYILSSDYINSNYFNCRLVNCFWTLDEDINDLITKTETSVKIVLKYSGEMEIVREDRDDMIRGFDEPYMISARSRSPWPNPEIEYIQLDTDNLRKYLEHMFPGIPFDVEVDMQYREGDDFNWTKKHFTLARSYSNVDDCIQKYKEANNL